jgi:hypothetical protein
MSCCIPINGKHLICLGCGEPVADSTVDPKWHKKRHVTVGLTLDERPMDGSPEWMHNPHYQFTVHSIECMQKVDWNKVKEAILEAENKLSRQNKAIEDVGV